mgnify:FL=1|tara:strand:- start:80 stop:445 length:366 start_codon:yes stop_codon:yes gene_type:complete
MFVLMFVDETGKFIFDIKKTFNEVKEFKNKNEDIVNSEVKKKENKLNIENTTSKTLFTESEIQLINSLNSDYHIKIFSYHIDKTKVEYKNATWNQLITLTLKDSDTEKKIKHIERWLFHFS